MSATRREFLQIAGSGLAAYPLLSLTGCLRPTPHTSPAEAPIAAAEQILPSVCLQCPAGCGILVRVTDGRATKIEGNPLFLTNRGKTCPKGQIGLQILYDPDRIKGPMKRAGERGSGKWQSVSWEAAITEIAARLNEIRGRGEAHTILVMSGRNRGQMGDLIGRFCDALGTPNNVGHSSICEDGSPMGHWMTQGWKAYAAYDWARCDYVLSFGGSLIEAWRPTASLLRLYGEMRQGRPGRRTKIVQIDPRFSVTAAKADEWIPIKPGTDGALALGLAHVIVRERLYEADFVRQHTFGFEDWKDAHGTVHIGFGRFVLEQYPPRKVAEITGVEPHRIEQIAREFAAKQPHCIAAGARGSSMQPNGAYNRFAIHALNGLVGSIDVPGGILRQIDPPLTPWPPVTLDEAAAKGKAMPRLDYAGTARYPLAGKVYQDIPDRILAGQPYQVNALFCYYTNPMFSSPDVARWRKAIAKVPLVVTFSPFLDETTVHADYILPDHTYLERWHDDVIYPSVGFPHVGIRQPVVKPLYDTRNAADTLLTIAREMGGSVAASFPWGSMEEILRFRYQGVFRAGRGNFTAATFDDWWGKFTRYGVWNDPPYPFATRNPEQWKRVLAAPSGKFEFYSQGLREKLEHLAEEAKPEGAAGERPLEALAAALKLTAHGDALFLPHYEPPRFVGDPHQYPLVLITYKTVMHAEGRGANSPLAQEKFNVQVQEGWTADVQMNPETAKRLGLEDRDEVWVESPIGKIRTGLRLAPHHPDIVAMPFELGHTHYGRFAQGRGANPNEVIANEHDLLGGLAAWSSTRVKVYRA